MLSIPGGCMKKKLKSLSGFIAFESAARHLNFSKASKELYVTQSAISKQVKQLEETLGFKLFHRLTRRLELTEKGERLYLAVNKSIGEIEQTLENIEDLDLRKKIILSAPSTFTLKWLIPRLGTLNVPEIELFIEAENKYVDLSKKTTDIAIRYDSTSHSGYHSRYFMDEYLVPVCSSDFLTAPVFTINDLQDYTFLYDLDKIKWNQWLRSVNGFGMHKGPRSSF